MLTLRCQCDHSFGISKIFSYQWTNFLAKECMVEIEHTLFLLLLSRISPIVPKKIIKLVLSVSWILDQLSFEILILIIRPIFAGVCFR